jgi:hypothetical protein
MIRPLRHRHRWQVLALGILLPVAFVFGVLGRKPVPVAAELPADLAPAPLPLGNLVWNRDHLFPNAPVSTRLWEQRNHSSSFAVDFSAPASFIKPDLLVYWLEKNPDLYDGLPTNAVLLGAFGSAALPIPDHAANPGGEFVLYSLADGEVVDASQPIQLNPVSQPPKPQ